LLHAYEAYAAQLMYNDGQGYSSSDGGHDASFINQNVAALNQLLFCRWSCASDLSSSLVGDLGFWIGGFGQLVWISASLRGYTCWIESFYLRYGHCRTGEGDG
jgi:hypothetical protein